MNEFNLSEKQAKILVRKIQNQPDFEIVENETHTKIIVKEPIEIDFEDGFFKSDVKEFIRLLKNAIKTIHENDISDWEREDLLKDIDELAGKAFI